MKLKHNLVCILGNHLLWDEGGQYPSEILVFQCATCRKTLIKTDTDTAYTYKSGKLILDKGCKGYEE